MTNNHNPSSENDQQRTLDERTELPAVSAFAFCRSMRRLVNTLVPSNCTLPSTFRIISSCAIAAVSDRPSSLMAASIHSGISQKRCQAFRAYIGYEVTNSAWHSDERTSGSARHLPWKCCSTRRNGGFVPVWSPFASRAASPVL